MAPPVQSDNFRHTNWLATPASHFNMETGSILNVHLWARMAATRQMKGPPAAWLQAHRVPVPPCQKRSMDILLKFQANPTVWKNRLHHHQYAALQLHPLQMHPTSSGYTSTLLQLTSTITLSCQAWTSVSNANCKQDCKYAISDTCAMLGLTTACRYACPGSTAYQARAA
jgi:hypothetical protein